MTLNPHQFGPPTTPAQPEPERTNFAHFNGQQVRQRQSNNYNRLKEIDVNTGFGGVARFNKFSRQQVMLNHDEIGKIRKQDNALRARDQAIRMDK
jgi:hypothetical protein